MIMKLAIRASVNMTLIVPYTEDLEFEDINVLINDALCPLGEGLEVDCNLIRYLPLDQSGSEE
jgi:hypothetical protein